MRHVLTAFFALFICPCVFASENALSIQKILENDNGFCAVLSHEPDKTADLADLNAYFRLSDNSVTVDNAIPVISGRRICYTTLKNGSAYTLTVRKGLKYGNGQVLQADLNAKALIPDAKSSIFLERGQVLSKSLSSKKITLGTLNAPDLDAYLYRIPSSDLLASNALLMTSDSLEAYNVSSLVGSHAQLLGKTRLEIPKTRNERVLTTLDLDKTAGSTLGDGVYLVIACDSRSGFDGYNTGVFYNTDRIWVARVITLTDLGVSVYRSSNSIAVAARSLKGANPVAAANVTLYSKSNDVLQTVVTDASGYARFSGDIVKGRGAMAPSMVAVTSGQDAFSLNLNAPPLKLSDIKDVKDLPQGSLEAYAYTARGIYRPGESVRYTALVRNKADLTATALKALTLEISRPDGTMVKSMTLTNSGAGVFEGAYTLPNEGQRGAWTFTLKSGEHDVIDSSPVVTADFIPSSLEARIEADSKDTHDSNIHFSVLSRYTYGAPGAGARVSGMMTISPDPHPLDNFKDFTFGPDTESYSKLTSAIGLDSVEADKDGVARFNIPLKSAPYARKIDLSVSVFAQGSDLPLKKELKQTASAPLIGFKSADDGFDTVLCKDGRAVEGSVRYVIFRVDTDYQYVFDHGQWKYLKNERLSPVLTGNVRTLKDKAVFEKTQLQNGAYLAMLEGDGAKTAVRFYSGYQTGSDSSSPDIFEVTSDKESYLPDDKVTLSFEARDDGGADLIVGSDDIKLMRRFDVRKGHNEISFRMPKDAVVSERALVTITTPSGDKISSPRAMGLSLLKLNSDDKIITAALNTPGSVKPGDELKAELTLSGADESAMYTAALVDTGVLTLTSYKSPSPQNDFLKPAAYGIRVYDRYGALLRSYTSQDQGHGDLGEALMRNASSPQALEALRGRIVALYSSARKTQNGKAEIRFKIPENFQGGLRLMVVAADDRATGSVSSDIMVRDEIAPSISLPAILHKDDEVRGYINLQNTSDRGKLSLSLAAQCQGAIECKVISAEPAPDKGQMISIPFEVRAAAEGKGRVSLSVKGKGIDITREFETSVLSADPMALSSATVFLKKGQTERLEPKPRLDGVSHAVLTRGFLPGDTRDEFIRKIRNTQYISSADLSSVILALIEMPDNDSKDAALTQDLVSLLQSRSGSGTDFDQTLEALNYAALLKARKAGFDVSDELCDRMLSRLKRDSGSQDPSGPVSMFALSELHEGDLSELRYSFDNAKNISPIAAAAYAMAFRAYGDDTRCKDALRLGFNALSTLEQLLSNLNQAANTEQALKAANTLSSFEPTVLSDPDFDRAMLLAAASLTRNTALINRLTKFRIKDLRTMAVLSWAGASMPKTSSESVTLNRDGTFNVTNNDKDAFFTISAYGYPKTGEALSKSVNATAGFYDISDPSVPTLVSSLKRGDVVMMVYTVKREIPRDAQVTLRFALPSGFSFEGAVSSDSALGEISGITDCQVRSGDSGIILSAWPSSDEFKVGVLVRPQYEGKLKVPAVSYDENGSVSSELIHESSKVLVRDDVKREIR